MSDPDAVEDPASLPIFNPPAPTGPPRNGHRRPAAATRLRLASPDPVPAARPRVPGEYASTSPNGLGLPPAPTAGSVRTRRAREGEGLDWQLVAAFRAQASDQLTRALGEEHGGLNRDAERELGRSIIAELLQSAAAENLSEGRASWSLTEQDAVASAVFDALFGLGRLQPLVDDPSLENIIITGQTVWLEDTDGRLFKGPPVADSDEELIDFLMFLGTRSEVNPRAFSPANPVMHMRLDGGARLAAAAWVTPRPSVVIRRHGMRKVVMDDLVENNTLSPVMASFLAAAVKARLSIVVPGEQGAGKTTLVRGLCSEIDPWEAIGTFETEYELHLHEMPERHLIVHPFEARPGSGEVDAAGHRAGEFTLAQAMIDSYRFNLSRTIVGEVRGSEVWQMIKAMESGAGSISTTHARDAGAAMRKLVTCAMEQGPQVTKEIATSKLAESIDLIVQVHLKTTRVSENEWRRTRWVSEILAVTSGEQDKGYATTRVFSSVPGGPAVAETLPDDLRHLQAHGFDLDGFLAEAHDHAGRS